MSFDEECLWDIDRHRCYTQPGEIRNKEAIAYAFLSFPFLVPPETVIIPIISSIIIFPIVVAATIMLLRHYNRRARAKDKFRYAHGFPICKRFCSPENVSLRMEFTETVAGECFWVSSFFFRLMNSNSTPYEEPKIRRVPESSSNFKFRRK